MKREKEREEKDSALNPGLKPVDPGRLGGGGRRGVVATAKAARGIRNDRKRKGVRSVNASVKGLKRAS